MELPIEEPDLDQVWQQVWLGEVWQPEWRCLSGEQPSGSPPQMAPAKGMLLSKKMFLQYEHFKREEVETNQESILEIHLGIS